MDKGKGKRWLWFIGLWCASVATLAILAMFIKLLIP